jgi:hypothetical protein
MSYVLPESSFNTYLSPCFVTVPENVCVPAALAADGSAALDPDCEGGGVVASGLCEDGDCEEDGVRSVLSGGGVGVVSGVDDGCCAWLFGVVEGVVSWAWSALPQEIIPSAIARVARNDSV